MGSTSEETGWGRDKNREDGIEMKTKRMGPKWKQKRWDPIGTTGKWMGPKTKEKGWKRDQNKKGGNEMKIDRMGSGENKKNTTEKMGSRPKQKGWHCDENQNK